MPTLDVENPTQLAAYLQGPPHGFPAPTEMMVLRGGVSNKTVLVSFPNRSPIVVKQALAKLRVAADWYSSPARIHNEAAGLRWLCSLAPEGSIPELVFEDAAQHALAMRAVPAPHVNWKTMLLRGEIEDGHVRQFAQLLAAIHGNSASRAHTMRETFADRTFFESLRIDPYYRYSAKTVPAASAFLARLIDETNETRQTVVHGDYSPKNVLVHDSRLVLLDFEVVHFGDPAFDIGFSLTHFLSKAHHIEGHRQRFAAAAKRYWRDYIAALGKPAWCEGLEARSVRHTLGCLLARVRGKSPLEYLDERKRSVQAAAVVSLMAQPPDTVAQLTDRFLQQIDDVENR